MGLLHVGNKNRNNKKQKKKNSAKLKQAKDLGNLNAFPRKLEKTSFDISYNIT